MKILLTGAGGYIGSRVFSDLLRGGHDVVGIDNFCNAQIDEIHGKKIVNVDISDIKKLKNFFPVDRVIHLAAISGVLECEENKDLAYSSNVVGTANLAYLCDKYHVPLLFASSMAVYGESKFPIKEEDPKNPLNFYGKTKLFGMNIIKLFRNRGYIFIVSNVYGTHVIDGKKINSENVINKFIENVKKGKQMEIYKPGTQARNFIHVNDVSRAYCVTINKIEGLKDVCLASNESLSVNKIAEMVKKYGKKYNSEIQVVDNPRKETLVENFEVDTSRMKSMSIDITHNVEDEIKKNFLEARIK